MKREVPDYVRRGSCGDCLKVWGRDRDALLRKIDALERHVRTLTEENRALRVGNGRPNK